MSESELKADQWPDQATHDRVRDAYVVWIEAQRGAYTKALRPTALDKYHLQMGASICTCCGSSGFPVPSTGLQDVDSIRVFPKEDRPCPDTHQHIIIKDEKFGDVMITWRDQ